MKIVSVTSPQWSDAAHTSITATVEFKGVGVVPFSASPIDVEKHGRDLYAALLAGTYGAITAHDAEKEATKIARELKQAKRTADKATAKADPIVASMLDMTPVQLDAYIEANAGNLKDLRDFVKKLALIVLVDR